MPAFLVLVMVFVTGFVLLAMILSRSTRRSTHRSSHDYATAGDSSMVFVGWQPGAVEMAEAEAAIKLPMPKFQLPRRGLARSRWKLVIGSW